jgi:hypothetical protein
MPVVNRVSYGRTMRDLNTAVIAGVAKKPLIVTVHRNQTITRSLRSLPRRRRKILSISN